MKRSSLAAWLCVLAVCMGMAGGALAEYRDTATEKQPEGAVFATPTVKPWLRPTPVPTAIVPPTQAPTPTPTPSPAPTPQPTATPTPTPVPTPTPTPPKTPILIPPEKELPTLEPLATATPEETPAGLLVGTPIPTETPKPIPTPEPTAEPVQDELRLLLVGTDAHDYGEPGHADAVMLVVIRPAKAEIRLASFVGEMYISLPGSGKDVLNTAYYNGGINALTSALESNFGVHVDGTLALDFAAMERVVDDMGGVLLDISSKERAAINSVLRYDNEQRGVMESDGLLTTTGMQILMGKQALSYGRILRLDSEFGRVERQQKLLQAIIARMKDMELSEILALVASHWDTAEASMGPEQLTALLPLLLETQVISYHTLTVPQAGMYYDDVENGRMVLVPDVQKNRDALEAFLAE